MRFTKVTLRRMTNLAALVTAISLWLARPAWAAPLGQEAQAAITSPTEGQEIVGLVTISGSASHPDFDRYELAYGPEPNPNDAWQPFGGNNQPISHAVLGVWDTTKVADGTYSLRLRVVRHDGNYTEVFVRGLRVRNQQPTGTPTSIPPAPTFGPEATLVPVGTVLVEQPPTSVPAVSSSAGSATSGGSASRRSNSASGFDGSLITSACLSGILWAFGLFGLLGAIQVGRIGYKQYLRRQRKKT